MTHPASPGAAPARPAAPTTPQAVLSAALAQIEARIESVGQALVAGDAPALEAAATALRDVSTVFSQRMATPGALAVLSGDAALRNRMLGIGRSLALHRTQMARRAAVVSRSLESVMPSMGRARQVTYGAGPARRGRFG